MKEEQSVPFQHHWNMLILEAKCKTRRNTCIQILVLNLVKSNRITTGESKAY